MTSKPALTTAALVARARAALSKLRSYRATLDVLTLAPTHGPRTAMPSAREQMKGKTVLAVERPSRMKMDVHVDVGGRASGIDMRIVFDGKTMWARTTMRSASAQRPARVVHLRLDQLKLAPKGGFEVDFSVQGHGLGRERDLVDTVLEMLDRYRFRGAPSPRSLSTGSCLEVTGHSSTEQVIAHVLDDPHQVGPLLVSLRRHAAGSPGRKEALRSTAGLLARLIRDLDNVWLCLDPQTFLPRRWAIGHDHRWPMVTVTVEQLASEKLGVETFRIDPSVLSKATDFTPSVVTLRQQMQQALADGGLRLELAEALHQALKGPSSAPSKTISGPRQP